MGGGGTLDRASGPLVLIGENPGELFFHLADVGHQLTALGIAAERLFHVLQRSERKLIDTLELAIALLQGTVHFGHLTRGNFQRALKQVAILVALCIGLIDPVEKRPCVSKSP